ncbi:MAG: aldehyde dehydrogenase family protein [Polyangiales bacterium]
MTTNTTMQVGSAAIPEARHTIEPTSKAQIDESLAVLQDHKQAWVDLSIDDRIKCLQDLIHRTVGVSDRWIESAIKAKKLRAGSAEEAEEWFAGPAVVIRNMQLLIRSLTDIAKHGVPQLPKRAYERSDGQVVAPVYPTDVWDSLLFTGFTAEVWMDPRVKLSELSKNQAEFYRTQNKVPKVALVLGAGNVSSIGPMDALYKLFVEGQVVVLKMNPVNEYLGPIIEDAFASLVDAGFFRVVYGGAVEGEYLCQHDLVDEIHITGSDKTHDAIVFGVGEEGRRNKEQNRRKNNKRITSELGNVSPVIVVPGPWSTSDVAYQGENIASSLCNNAGFNCNATRVIVQHESWSQRNALVDAIKKAFSKVHERYPYYPGAEDRHDRFVAAHPNANQFGAEGEGKVPWTLISHLDPTKKDDICFNTEAWCGVTSEVALTANSVAEYIDKAVDFCNDEVWGSLNAAIIVHPESLKDPTIAAAVERGIANLRHGAVAVNHWPALAYAFVSTTWGAFPGHTDQDIRSGRGVVHNSYLFDHPQKSVVRGPFRVRPKPGWFASHKTAAELGRKLTYFNADPSVIRIPSLLWSALRG